MYEDILYSEHQSAICSVLTSRILSDLKKKWKIEATERPKQKSQTKDNHLVADNDKREVFVASRNVCVHFEFFHPQFEVVERQFVVYGVGQQTYIGSSVKRGS